MIKFAMIFPGQGNQDIRIIKKLYNNYSIIKKTFDKASEYLKYNITEKIFKKKINNTVTSQIEILIISIALFNLWKEIIGIHPKIMTGHSLGQYSVYVCSKILKFSDAIKIVKYREKIMKKNQGYMNVIIGLKKKNIIKICKNFLLKKKISIACINSKKQIIITGKKKYIYQASLKLKKFGARYIIDLPIKTISHCSSMKKIKNLLLKKCKNISFNNPKFLILDSVKIKFINNSIKIKNYLINQLCHTIQWKKTIDFILLNNIKYFLEINSSNVLNKLNQNKINYFPLNIKNIFNLK
ncbi:acyltransferase domain-containing protein [Buchnera aphidicola]|uniref:acyltransferase domain-containing protein n=1 Tax=Buchnera aphidicola TaxID=9 RepID=UPI0031B8369C